MLAPCGMNCETDCTYFPADCAGCHTIRGVVFWTEFVDATVCDIYDCCVNERHLPHCGHCPELPCARHFSNEDPNVSREDAQADHNRRMNVLKQAKKEPQ